MKSFLRALALVLVAACVPATEDIDPRGGVVVRLAPTAESTGAPFASKDGWTITIEQTALRALVFAQRRDEKGESAFIGGGGYPSVINPSSSACELIGTQMVPGPAEAIVQLIPSYPGFNDRQAECGVTPEILARFDENVQKQRHVDKAGNEIPSFRSGPSLIVIGRAEKNGRVIRFDLGLDISLFGNRDETSEAGVPVTVVANQGALVHMTFNIAALFKPPPGASEAKPVSFGRVAAADTNDDGIVTYDELDAAKNACTPGNGPRAGDPFGTYDDDEDPSNDYTPDCGSILSDIQTENGRFLFSPSP